MNNYILEKLNAKFIGKRVVCNGLFRGILLSIKRTSDLEPWSTVPLPLQTMFRIETNSCFWIEPILQVLDCGIICGTKKSKITFLFK